jgi:lysophospholipase L1-like esterase
MNRSIRHIIRLTAFASVVAVGAASVGLGSPAGAAVRPLTIVAVGDSYASGEGARGGITVPWLNAACHRSALAGPQDAAGRFDALPGRSPTSFTSAACSGATTANIIGQLNSVSGPRTAIDAVTISIGGNDVGFAPLVLACVDPRVRDCSVSPEAAATTAALATLPATLDALFASINARPGIRNVFVTEYPDPTTGLDGALCGTWGNPGFEGFEFIRDNEAAFASASLVMPLNDALANAVATADAASGPHAEWHFVSGIVRRFATHGYCTGGGSPSLNPLVWNNPRFINTPIDSLSPTSQGDIFGSMHPNPDGQHAIGDALFDAMAFLAGPVAVGVSSSPAKPVAGLPATLTVQANDGAGTPVPGASVVIDGQVVGTTNASGTFTGSHVFATRGAHIVVVSTTTTADSYADGSAGITVAGQDYTVTPSPAPIPLDTTIAQLSVSTTDANGAQVPGVFTLVDGLRAPNGVSILGTRTRTFRNGDVNTGWKVHPILIRGYPEPEMACPTLTFRPDSQMFVNKDVSSLIDCVA